MSNLRERMDRELSEGALTAQTARDLTCGAYAQALAPAAANFMKRYASHDGTMKPAFAEAIKNAALNGKTEVQYTVGPISWDFAARGFAPDLLEWSFERKVASLRKLVESWGHEVTLKHAPDRANDRIDLFFVVSWRGG